MRRTLLLAGLTLFAAAPIGWADQPTVRIIEEPVVSQPPPFSSGGRTVVVPRTRIIIDDGNARPAKTTPVTIEGKASVIEGDTLRIEGRIIRLFGVDAAEDRQTCRAEGIDYPCGTMATARLVELTLGRTVRCEGDQRSRDGTLLASCRAGDTDLNAAMVGSGWALAFRRESERYVRDEERAKKKRKGLWRGGFARPWDWRIRH